MRAYEVSCRVRAGEAARPASFSAENDAGFTPRNRERFQVRFSVDRLGPPPPSVVFVDSPAPRTELGAIGGEGQPPGISGYCSTGFEDGNWSYARRHLLPGMVFSRAANTSRGLKPHHVGVFQQVSRERDISVATLLPFRDVT